VTKAGVLATNPLFLPIISPVADIMGEDDLFPPEVKNAARDGTSSGVDWDCACDIPKNLPK